MSGARGHDDISGSSDGGKGGIGMVDDGQANVERLTNRIRLHYLGPFTASDALRFPFGVPATWQPGRLRFFQGMEIDGPSGALIERANCVLIVVH